MFSALSAYITFARLAFQRQNAYRVANWAGLFTNIFFLFFRASLFESIYANGQIVSGLNVEQTLSYVCLTQAILMVVPQWGFLGVEEDIRSGQIAIHLSRPVSYYFSTLAQRLGGSGFYLLFRALPLVVVGAAAGFLFLPASPLHLIAFFLSIFFGAWIAISIHFLTELSAFWMESARGMKMLSIGLINFFSGMVLPLPFFPEAARNLSKLLPFEYTLNAPTLIYLGAEESMMRLLLTQIVWMGIMGALCVFFLHMGERKVVLHGG